MICFTRKCLTRSNCEVFMTQYHANPGWIFLILVWYFFLLCMLFFLFSFYKHKPATIKVVSDKTTKGMWSNKHINIMPDIFAFPLLPSHKQWYTDNTTELCFCLLTFHPWIRFVLTNVASLHLKRNSKLLNLSSTHPQSRIRPTLTHCIMDIQRGQLCVFHVWCIAVSQGDDGWIHQLLCLLIKWLYLNTTSNRTIGFSSKPQMIDVLNSIFSLFTHPFPPLSLSVSSLHLHSVRHHVTEVQCSPSCLASQQVIYSEKPHKWPFISITKRHQPGCLFPMARRPTQPVLFGTWNVACARKSRCSNRVETQKARFPLLGFIKVAEVKLRRVLNFNTNYFTQLVMLWWKRALWWSQGVEVEGKIRPPAAFRRCEGLSRFQLLRICPPSNKRGCVGTGLPCCTKDVLYFPCTYTHLNTHWNTWPLKPFSLSQGTRFWAPAYKYLFADSLLVFWAAKQKSKEL